MEIRGHWASFTRGPANRLSVKHLRCVHRDFPRICERVGLLRCLKKRRSSKLREEAFARFGFIILCVMYIFRRISEQLVNLRRYSKGMLERLRGEDREIFRVGFVIVRTVDWDTEYVVLNEV